VEAPSSGDGCCFAAELALEVAARRVQDPN
jgi:hypothetical protein